MQYLILPLNIILFCFCLVWFYACYWIETSVKIDNLLIFLISNIMSCLNQDSMHFYCLCKYHMYVVTFLAE